MEYLITKIIDITYNSNFKYIDAVSVLGSPHIN